MEGMGGRGAEGFGGLQKAGGGPGEYLGADGCLTQGALWQTLGGGTGLLHQVDGAAQATAPQPELGWGGNVSETAPKSQASPPGLPPLPHSCAHCGFRDLPPRLQGSTPCFEPCPQPQEPCPHKPRPHPCKARPIPKIYSMPNLYPSPHLLLPEAPVHDAATEVGHALTLYRVVQDQLPEGPHAWEMEGS